MITYSGSHPFYPAPLVRIISNAALAFCTLLLLHPAFADPPVNVLTNHNDNARTGANLSEQHLSVAEIAKPDRFGKLFSRTVDGQIYAQPLYLSDIEMADRVRHNVVFVATTHDTVYAFDADNADGANDKPLWKTRLLDLGPKTGVKAIPIPSSDYDYSILFGLVSQKYLDLTPEIGVVGTPVISPDGLTLYVVAASRENGDYVHRLHALNTRDGKEKSGSPVTITGSVVGIGDNTDGPVLFRPRQQMARPALLWSGGVVYVAFGSHGDLIVNSFDLGHLFDLLPGYHGWIFAYDAATLRCLDIFNSTPNGGVNAVDAFLSNEFGGGGIWMSGAGPSADDAGNIYFSVGNGAFDANKNGGDYGDSVVKLALDPVTQKFRVDGFFTPYNQQLLEKKDLDLGSCGVLLLPREAEGHEHRPLMLTGGKEGKLYLINRNKPGGFDPKADACLQSFLAAYSTAETRKAQKDNFEPGARQPHHKTNQTYAHKLLNAQTSSAAASPAGGKQRPVDAQVSNIHSAPVYWQSSIGPLVYIWGEDDVLKAFGLVDGRFKSDPQPDPSCPDPVGKSLVRIPPGMPGAMLSLSAYGNDSKTGVIWASHPYRADANQAVVPGILQAFDATPVPEDTPEHKKGELQMLWSSMMDAADDVGDFAKFCPPTVANGKVYLATFSCQLEVYGLLKERQTLPPTDDTFVQAGPFSTLSLSAQHGVVKRELNISRAARDVKSGRNRCGYLKFDLTGITQTPKTAMLTLTVYQPKPSNQEATMRVYGLATPQDQAWDYEHTAWNNAPELNRADFTSQGELIAVHRVFNKRGTVTFDVTNFIAAHLGTVITLQLLPDKGRDSSVTFISRRDTEHHTLPLDQNFRPNPQKTIKAGEPFLTLTWY